MTDKDDELDFLDWIVHRCHNPFFRIWLALCIGLFLITIMVPPMGGCLLVAAVFLAVSAPDYLKWRRERVKNG